MEVHTCPQCRYNRRNSNWKTNGVKGSPGTGMEQRSRPTSTHERRALFANDIAIGKQELDTLT